MARLCAACGSALSEEAAICSRCGQPAPAAFTAGYDPNSAAKTLAMAGEPACLSNAAPIQVAQQGGTAEIQQWNTLRGKVLAQGDSIAQSFGAEPTGFVRIIAWMVRATCLDRRVARAAAQDKGGNGAAIAALAIGSIPTIAFGALFNGFRMGFLPALAVTLILTVVTFALMFFVLSMLSAGIVDAALSVDTLLRVLAYPQAILAFSAIPILGGFIGPVARIWSIVASAEAVREVSNARAEKAIIFAAIGALIQAVAWMILSVLAARTAMWLQIR